MSTTTTPPIQAQIGPGATVPSGLSTITNPLYPPQTLLFRLRSLPTEVYRLTPSSHLFRLLGVLLGDAGGEQLRKQGLVNRLRGALTSTHFLDMDAFWGDLFGLNRNSSESLPYNPITGVTLNPYTDAVPPALWVGATQADAYYRSRIFQFAQALSYGPSPVGIKKVSEAVLGMPVDMYETFQSNPAVYQVTIVPHGIISQADIFNLHNILNRIKSAQSIITITQGMGDSYAQVSLAQAWASSSMWEVHAQITPGLTSLFSNNSTRPRYAFSGYQGESWPLNGSIRTIGSQSWDAAGNVLSSTDFEHYVWPDSTFTNFSPDLSVMPAWLAGLGRMVQSGVSHANPLNMNGASPVLFDGMNATALATLLENSSLVNQNTSNRFWSTPARLATDTTQEVITYAFDQPHYMNSINFEVANYPHIATLWVQDPPSGIWTAVYTYSNATASPPVFTDSTSLLNRHEHPQHFTNDAWVPVNVRFPTASVQNVKVTLQRFSGYGPLDIYGNAAAYSLGVRNFNASNIVDDPSLLPVMGDTIDSSFNVVGDQITYNAYQENPNFVLNSKNSVTSATLGANLTAGTTYTSVTLNTTSGQTFLVGSYLVIGAQQVKIAATVTATGATTSISTASFTVSSTHSSGERVTVVNPQWRSGPQPSVDSIVNYYIDARSSAGAAQVIDTLYVEPTHAGVTANLYWSNSIPTTGTAVDENLSPSFTSGTLTPSIQGLYYSPTADGGGYFARTGFRPRWLGASYWAGISFIPQTAVSASGGILSIGPFTVKYGPSGTGITLSWEVGGLPYNISLGDVTPNQINSVVVGYIDPTQGTDLGSVGLYGLIYLGVNGQYVTQQPIGVPDFLNQWWIGSEGQANNFTMTNFVLKGEPLSSENGSGYMDNPRPYCWKGQFGYQDTGLTQNAYIRFDPSFIGVSNDYGFVGGTPDGTSQMEWVPIVQDFILNKGYMTFRPTLANFYKIEMSNLVPEPFNVFLPQIQTQVQLTGPNADTPGTGSSTYQGAAPTGTATALAIQSGQPMFPNTQSIPTSEPDSRSQSSTATLVADTPLLAQALSSRFPSFGFSAWSQGGAMPLDTSGRAESYITQDVNQLNQMAFFCGFYTVQAFRSNIASQTDTPVYVERFLDQQNYLL